MKKEVKPSEVIIKDTAKPLEVVLDKTEPLAVTLDKEATEQIISHSVNKDKHKTKAPTTTEEEDRSTLGQRNINLIWETTQSNIAKMAVYVGISINVVIPICMLFIRGEVEVARIAIVGSCLNTVSTTVGIIIGFYFSRTNHSAIGGTGKKPSSSSAGTR